MSGCHWFPLNHNEIRAWLARHPEALPRNLAELARFPIPFRKVMVNAVPQEVRVALWQEHLETFLQPTSDITPAQREFLRATLPRLSGLLSAPAPNPVMTEFEREMSQVFSREAAWALFGVLGPPEPPGGTPLPPDALPSGAV